MFVEFQRLNKITRKKTLNAVNCKTVYNITSYHPFFIEKNTVVSKLLKQQFELNKTFDDISSKNAHNFTFFI